jgi:hypothetical protein
MAKFDVFSSILGSVMIKHYLNFMIELFAETNRMTREPKIWKKCFNP